MKAIQNRFSHTTLVTLQPFVLRRELPGGYLGLLTISHKGLTNEGMQTIKL